ncbi:alpha/beta fold hydrolase [Alkanindiges illinoisensis]|uniref:alpha/beta fold hydrolase n=1 Tax=Alkanindiges illinoisensis TaxID=197183 RepID=UPI00047D62E8|nr:alpha/beta hydrolase [Alkanindiges illinoisensis]
MKPLIHFAHANGIPSKVYSKFFDALADEYDVVFLPEIGTDPKYPISNHWTHLVTQVIDSIERQAQGRPVIAMGHSLGGLLSFMAAYRRPELFQQLIMLDPPLINGFPSFGIHLAKLFNQKYVDKLTPAGISINRRDNWESREEAATKLKSRGFFANFDPQCFDDYIRYGLTDDPIRGGVTLSIPKMAEVEIFRTNPSLFWFKPRKAPKIPVKLVVGQSSQFLQRGFPQRVKRLLGIEYIITEGGHMFPLEHPEQVARLVKQLIVEQQK